MAKDKKSKAAEKKARVAAKQTKKAAHKEKKTKSRGTEDSDVEDVDLESVLAEYAKKVRNSSQQRCLRLMFLARAIPESHGSGLRTTVSALFSNPHWISIKFEGAFLVRW